jgi:hypothetical protein
MPIVTEAQRHAGGAGPKVVQRDVERHARARRSQPLQHVAELRGRGDVAAAQVVEHGGELVVRRGIGVAIDLGLGRRRAEAQRRSVGAQLQHHHRRGVGRVVGDRVRPRQRHALPAQRGPGDLHRRCSCRKLRIAGTNASAPSSNG